MGFLKRPKVPGPTAQENAMQARNQSLMDEEIGKGEKRLKAAARGKLGSASLMAKASAPKAKAKTNSGARNYGNVSMFGGGGR